MTPDDSEYVFVNENTKEALTDCKRAFVTALRKAGIEDFHFHDLRHTCATRLGDRGASAFEIAQVMGWSDIQMAMRYTHATGEGIGRRCSCPHKANLGRMGAQIQAPKTGTTQSPHNNGNGQLALPVND